MGMEVRRQKSSVWGEPKLSLYSFLPVLNVICCFPLCLVPRALQC